MQGAIIYTQGDTCVRCGGTGRVWAVRDEDGRTSLLNDDALGPAPREDAEKIGCPVCQGKKLANRERFYLQGGELIPIAKADHRLTWETIETKFNATPSGPRWFPFASTMAGDDGLRVLWRRAVLAPTREDDDANE